MNAVVFRLIFTIARKDGVAYTAAFAKGNILAEYLFGGSTVIFFNRFIWLRM
jgi:hypothetical protein